MSKSNLWFSPVYKFRIPSNHNEVKEVVIDVTTSAPSFGDPGKTLSRIFNQVFDYLKFEKDEKVNRILDFGAGKLRNALYFLEKDYYVSAVEFERLLKESKQATEMLARAKRFRARFNDLIYPHEFLKSSGGCDIVLLINVLNIMPVPSERLVVLQQCYEKLRQGGYLFWYTQHGDATYKDRCTPNNAIGDGHYTGENRKFKSFYREFSTNEIDELLLSNGFVFEKAFQVSHNQARLYKKQTTNVLKGVLTSKAIEAAITFEKDVQKPQSIEPLNVKRKKSEPLAEPNPDQLIIENLYIQKLKGLRPGKTQAAAYVDLVRLIVGIVFSGSLKNIDVEESTHGGEERIDIVATNTAKSGFFDRLSSKSKIACQYIPLECKNHSKELGNPEFDQLTSRFEDKYGMFGMMFYRRSKDKRGILRHCQRRVNKSQGFILAFDDQDLIALLKMKAEKKEEEIDNFMDKKFRALVERKKDE